MKKNLIGIILSCPFYAMSQTVDFEPFIGAGLSHGASASWELKPSLRAGSFINERHRLYSYLEHDVDSQTTNFAGSYDYFFPISKEQEWNIFLGSTLGKEFNNHYSNRSIIGAQTGLNYQFNNGISTEVGYRVHDAWSEWKSGRDMSRIESIYFSLDMKI